MACRPVLLHRTFIKQRHLEDIPVEFGLIACQQVLMPQHCGACRLEIIARANLFRAGINFNTAAPPKWHMNCQSGGPCTPFGGMIQQQNCNGALAQLCRVRLATAHITSIRSMRTALEVISATGQFTAKRQGSGIGL